MSTTETEKILEISERALNWCVKRNFEGYDPYDALNSPIARATSFGTRFGRIFWTQLLRRSPFNFRPALGIRPGANPKALALFLEGTVKLARFFERSGEVEKSARYRSLADSLFARLLAARAPGASGAAWGYNFPWQNRFQLLPANAPTLVNTSFAGCAALDYFEFSGVEEALAVAQSIPDFILKDLNRLTPDKSHLCFSYTPFDTNFVHNANLLGARFLARLATRYGREELVPYALDAVRYCVSRQLADGSWRYAERREQRWIDSFHTGFNLEALRDVVDWGLAPEFRDAFRKGVEFYADRFFQEDGLPKYYADRVYLVDIHSPAEAIYFFSGENDREELVEKILKWTLDNMYDAQTGVFYFRKSRLFTIKTPYMRWSQAWAFRALTERIARIGSSLDSRQNKE